MNDAKRTGMIRCGFCFALYALTLGCSQGPKPIRPPDISPSSVAAEAVDACDKNGDGLLDDAELAAGCPAILASLAKYDGNNDGKVSAEEIAARVASWSARGVGITSQSFYVFLGGRPLAGARVELIPEPFFDGVLFPAESGVNGTGMCGPTMAKEHLPEGVPAGVYCGLYRVKVTHPEKSIPPQYNEHSELGIEVCPDYDFYHPLKIQLKAQ